MPSVISHLCAAYLVDGHVVIVSRNETTIAVRLLSTFDLALHSGLILVRTTTLPRHVIGFNAVYPPSFFVFLSSLSVSYSSPFSFLFWTSPQLGSWQRCKLPQRGVG